MVGHNNHGGDEDNTALLCWEWIGTVHDLVCGGGWTQVALFLLLSPIRFQPRPRRDDRGSIITTICRPDAVRKHGGSF